MGIVQSKTGDISSTVSVTLDAPVTAGNALIVLLMSRFDVDVGVADNHGATYQSAQGYYYSATCDSAVKVAYAENVSAGTTSVQPNTDVAGKCVVLEVAGLVSSGIVDASTENQVTDLSAPFQPGLALTTVQAATFGIVLASDGGNDARICNGVAGDTTSFVSVAAGYSYGYAEFSSAGAKTLGLAFDAGDTWAMQAYSFKLSGAAPAALSGSAAATATATGTLTPNQSAAPIATISAGAWVPSTGASLPPMLSEAVPDHGTFIWVPTANSVCELLLTSLSDPGVSAGHVVPLWASSPVSATLRFRIMQGATQIAQWDHALTPTLTLYSHTLSGAEADAITDYTDLRVRIEAL